MEAIPIANLTGTRVVTVDYRLAPEHPFPAAIDDIVAVYKELLKSYRPNNIGVYGSSAGAILTAETAVRFRQLGLPLPAALGDLQTRRVSRVWLRWLPQEEERSTSSLGNRFMTEMERKKRGGKSAVIVERLVRVQLRAMSCDRFDIGIRRVAGEMILREGQRASEIEEAIKWLRHENAKGAHIYIRPAGIHGLSLTDDLTAKAIERMKTEGFEPAVVVETSSNNFQAWLNHGQILATATSTRAAKQLVERFGGDPSSADWRHFGRLAGFTNPKRERQLPSGMRPFARLRSATGRVYSKAAEFLAVLRARDDGLRTQADEPRKRRKPKVKVEVKALSGFHADPVYGGDLHRADMAWAKHAAGCGLTLEQIKTELLDGRDLGKKGSRKRQIEYAERTARKAVEQFGA